jgi:CDP-diacylglycerol pyrophosphatase
VVVGADRPDGQPGFVVLTDQADAATGNTAAGEELQDHAACRQPPAA